jgi:hypothetical protein
MRGFITEANMDEWDDEFPGIVAFYFELVRKPRTFLELVHAFVCRRAEESLSSSLPFSRA